MLDNQGEIKAPNPQPLVAANQLSMPNVVNPSHKKLRYVHIVFYSKIEIFLK